MDLKTRSAKRVAHWLVKSQMDFKKMYVFGSLHFSLDFFFPLKLGGKIFVTLLSIT